jgi:hypothetical protein
MAHGVSSIQNRIFVTFKFYSMKAVLIPLFFISLFSLVNCESTADENGQGVFENENETIDIDQGTVEERALRYIKAQLEIDATEKVTFEIHQGNIDGDSLPDFVFTLNRLEFAMHEAETKGNTAKKASLGFVGKYNYYFAYNSRLNEFSEIMVISSSASKSLEVSFENLTSDKYQNILIDYRIQDACFRDFLVLSERKMRRVFQWKVFDYLERAQKEFVYFDYQENPSGYKDIVLYEGKIENWEEWTNNPYSFTPKISKGNKELFRWFYLPVEGKYFIKNSK